MKILLIGRGDDFRLLPFDIEEDKLKEDPAYPCVKLIYDALTRMGQEREFLAAAQISFRWSKGHVASEYLDVAIHTRPVAGKIGKVTTSVGRDYLEDMGDEAIALWRMGTLKVIDDQWAARPQDERA